jgi:hypothetical protein
MRIFLGICILLFVGNRTIGQEFPPINGKDLNGSVISIPEDFKGKYTLVGLSYHQKAEDLLRSWFDPVFQKFVLKSGMFDDTYDVHVIFVPMFHGANKITFEKAFDSVKEKTDEKLYPYVMFYKGEIKSYKQKLSMDNKELPYLFLLDPEGKIIKTYRGRYREAYMDEIEDLLMYE